MSPPKALGSGLKCVHRVKNWVERFAKVRYLNCDWLRLLAPSTVTSLLTCPCVQGHWGDSDVDFSNSDPTNTKYVSV